MISDKLMAGDDAVDPESLQSGEAGYRASSPARRGAEQSAIDVYVHLAVDKDAVAWKRNRESGRLVGINDPTPYGYGRASAMGCNVTFSTSKRESRFEKLCRLGVRAIVGFDAVHAWRNRDAIQRADVVWTHTESQYLSVALVGALLRRRVGLIGQTIWLIDAWDALTWPRKALLRRLIARVDVLTVHSPENFARAKALFPATNVRLVKFGIPAEAKQAPRARAGHPVVNVMALGNDRHRDWQTLIDAVSGMPHLRLKILSGSVPKALVKNQPNIEVARATSNDELHRAFDEATLVCVPLGKNLHASGLTAIQEAVLSGVPVVATDVGGLSSYFSADEVRYVPPGDARALRAAFDEIAGDPASALERASRAQARMAGPDDIGAHAYVRRHVELSREILRWARA